MTITNHKKLTFLSLLIILFVFPQLSIAKPNCCKPHGGVVACDAETNREICQDGTSPSECLCDLTKLNGSLSHSEKPSSTKENTLTLSNTIKPQCIFPDSAEDTALLAKKQELQQNVSTMNLNGYAFSLYGKFPDEALSETEFLIITKDHKCLYAIRDASVNINWARPIQENMDSPQAMISGHSGGAHCCTGLYIISLMPFKVQEIGLGHSEGAFEQAVLYEVPQLTFYEGIFSYWNASFADSPAGKLIMDWKNGAYQLSPDMRKPPPNPAVLKQWQREITQALLKFKGPYIPIEHQQDNSMSENLNPIIWSHLVDLIYTGNPEIAAELFDRSWPSSVKGKREFWREFVNILKASEIWKPWHLSKTLDPEMTFKFKQNP